MDKYQLGASDMSVSPIGLGCWQFSSGEGIVGRFWQKLDPEVERDIVRVSMEGGINWFDTAEAYGWGRSEEALNNALRSLNVDPRQPDLFVATKWFPFFRFSRSMERTIGERHRRLGEFNIDLYQIHMPTSFSSIPSQMKVVADLIEDGRIRSAGVSNFSAAQMETAHRELKKRGHSLLTNQVRYSLLDRAIERNGVLETAKRLGVTIIAYSPLEQGILTGKFHEDPSIVRKRPGPRKYMKAFRESGLNRTRPLVDLLRQIGSGYSATPAQVALNWLVTFHGDRVVAIPGASSRNQAEQNAGAMKFALTQSEMEQIDDVSRSLT